ncbi:amino acid adenylation domain-containing protein [Crossiella equi]|uniref:Amino acid adenylation domain-containing protein n=1 Tax=Crossiella equi TaxID=130796 RepID=A0ABS5ATY7_9PSEU|nr:non-ribosomal peptide synthetase [Crossiella equi]MBP2479709.1 amino acid adenylation domain-containing protein [Crossiella equi]
MTSTRLATFVDLLRRNRDHDQHRVAITFVDPVAATRRNMSTGEWDLRSRTVAAHLSPGSRVLVVLPAGLDFFVALGGAFGAGCCAVPVEPPVDETAVRHVLDLADDAEAEAVLTDAATAELLARHGKATPRLLVVDALDPGPPEAELPVVAADDLALLLYTSGSTGRPKGVQVRHSTLMAWLDVLHTGIALPDGSTVVTWIPVHHVLGLNMVLLASALGGEAVLLAPDQVVGDPAAWLREISRARTPVFSGAPPFAYQHCVDLVPEQERAGLDLSRWEVALVGSERISPRVLASFTEAYLRHGFTGSAFFPSYGTTETMMVTAHRGPALPLRLTLDATRLERGEVVPSAGGESRATALVGVGAACPGVDVRVVDPETGLPRGTGEIGELWVAGPVVSPGYWHRAEETEQVFHARLADGTGPFLRTGDLAFEHGGEFVICGRLSELIIVRGRNLVAQDVEATVRFADPLLTAGPVAAFPVTGEDADRLVVVATVDPDAVTDPAELGTAIRRAVATAHGVELSELLLVAEGVPTTVTGKVRRAACRQAYLDGELRALAGRTGPGVHRAPRSEAERRLCALFADVLGVDDVGLDDDFFVLGGHSLLAMRLIGRMRTEFQAEIGIRDLFAASTAAELAELLTEARPARLALTARERPEVVPLSYAQQRQWFLHQLSEVPYTYNNPMAFRLSGRLDRSALRLALRDVVTRHESLRTVFVETDGVPVQQVVSAEVSLTELAAAEEEVAAACRYEFDLAAEIPVRAWLFEVGPEEHVLLVVVHHIAADGWSLGPLARDLRRAYAARRSGAVPEWAPLPVQYADYTLWQRELLGGEHDEHSVFARQREYWVHQLTGLPEVLDLPSDRPRPPVASHRGAELAVRVDADLHRRLAGLARGSGVSLFMVLQAGLAALLSRLGAGEDVPIGSPIAGRTDQALDELVGFFVNTLVLRTDVSGNPTFTELLTQVRQTTLAAYENQDIPFEYLVEALKPARSLAHHPLFQVMLTLQNIPAADVELAGLRTEFEPVSTGTAKFDLWFTLTEQFTEDGEPAGLSGVVEFATDLFDQTSVAGLFDRWVRLLAAAVADPARAVRGIDLLTSAERRRLLPVVVDGPEVRLTLPELFEERVRVRPDAVAVSDGALVLTYAELNAWANRLARVLVAREVRTGTVVALALPRGVHQVVAILAVLKAGAAYLPLELAYPPARVEAMVADAQPVLVVDEELVTTAAGDGSDLDLVRSPDDPAYVIYTSGSTGRPKGVVVPHRNVVRLFEGTRRWFGFSHEDVWTLFHSYAFDFSVWELWGALLHGGRLVVVPYEISRSPRRFLELLAEDRVTVLNQTPSAFYQLAQVEDVADLALRVVVFGGEALDVTRLREWRQRYPQGPALVNMYGITETTVHVTYAEPREHSAGVVGRALPDLQVYVLDDGLQPVPVGVVGEIYVGGAGLALGYLRRPGLTAARFVANPFGGPGSRLYRSGDLGRWSASGSLEHLGRADDQVQVRGFRVEPGEVESVLLEHPEVSQAAVVVRQDRADDTRLIAYAVATARTTVLRKHLQERLPEHMVPSAVVLLESLPLTGNGKLDRAALPVPDGAVPASRGPRGPKEQVLAELFASVLGVSRVGAEDSFFDLGGHSLLATQLIARVRAVLGVDVELRTLFNAPTVAGFAASLGESGTARPELVHTNRPDVVPLSFAQRRLWFLHQFEGMSATYNIPLGLRLRGALDREALRSALRDVVDRHESLRTVFVAPGGVPRQQLVAADIVPVESTARPAELPVLVAAACRYEFDLAAEIPVRAWLFEVGPEEHVLLVVVHHIAADGWSLRPLAHDLGRAYTARRTGRAPDWAELPVGYADYTLWQNELLGDPTSPDSLFTTQRDYWLNALAGLPEQLWLPTDRPRPHTASYRGAHLPVELSADLHRRLAGLARGSGVSLFMVLQAGLAALLSRLGAGEDVPIGSPIAGRTDQALDELVGFFVNTLVLRTDVSGNPTFSELLARVRETVLDAYQHQDIPFEYLVEALNPVRSTAYHPLVQVVLALQNVPAASFELAGLRTEFEPVSTGTAKFDLWFNLTERTGRNGEPAGLSGVVEFATDLFDRSSVAVLFDRWVRLLTAAVADPGQPVGTFDLLTPVERGKLLPVVTEPTTALPTIPALFEEQVRVRPEAVAVSDGALVLTYAELNAQANRLARALLARGAGPGAVVALALPRTAELVLALLAVLKTGAAYLPLDPAYPVSRLRQAVADAQPVLLVTTATLPGFADLPRLEPDEVDESTDSSNLGVGVAEQDPAYVIYTSGSTGRPKGVVVPHRNVVRLFEGTRRWFGFSHEDVWTLFHSYAFDFSVWELWGALLHGGRLVIVPHEISRSPRRFLELLAEERVTVLNQTPSAFYQLAQVADDVDLALRVVVFGGEALDVTRLRDWRERYQNAPALVNMYGITETTVHVTYLELEGEVPGSVGTPLPDLQVYVLDGGLQPVPVGVVGEIYVGGAGLALGYLRRPGLTAARFVANPFGGPGSRLYRSGDLGRWSASGSLEHLGRADDQVQVRGFRVEPGEVESVLLEHPEVSQAAVVARQDRADDTRLIAYAVKDQDTCRDRDELTEHDQVREWEEIYDSLYTTADGKVFGQDFAGWNSSYDGAPIPLAHMREWRDATVGRILSLRPRRVLEIGVGTGLLLSQVAPHCESYWATDLSSAVITALTRQLRHRPELRDRVVLRHQPAHELAGLPEGTFDTVVLNSIIQYFPTADYLTDVIEGALRLLAPGGAVFLGDVRDLRLQRVMATAVHRHRAGPDADPASVRQAVEQALVTEKELLLDPGFFTALPQRLDSIEGVDVQVKRGRHHNELTRYRYDVVVRKTGTEVEQLDGTPVLDWGDHSGGLAALGARLAEHRPDRLRVTGVANHRLAEDLAAGGTAVEAGTDPEEFFELGERHGYWVGATWSAAEATALDFVFVRGGVGAPVGTCLVPSRPASAVANDPGAVRERGGLVKRLREYLRERLPEHMVPSAVVLLESLPLTGNGKLDRTALPAPEVVVSGREPRGPREQVLAELFADVLGVARVGVEDSFFDLGGHSLLATRLIARVRAALGVEVELRTLFDAPTVADLATALDQDAAVRPALTAVARPEVVPLSFAQRRLWFLHQFEGPSATYNIPLGLRLTGAVDREALRLALRDVVARHESLRTVFVESDGVPSQRVVGAEPVLTEVVITVEELPEVLARACRYEFDLAAEIPVRAWLFEIGPEEHVLLVVVHHIAADGWSLGPLARDLGQGYVARCSGWAPEWTPLPVQYIDYTLWQHRLLGDRSDVDALLNTQLRYWTRALAGLPEQLVLPTDRPRPAAASHLGGQVDLQFGPMLHEKLLGLARDAGASLFMVLQAGLAALLSKLGAGEDVPIGSPIAGRTDQALDELVGFFVNTLVLRTDVSGNPTFTELLAQVRETVLDAYQHQDIPFEYLVEALSPARSLAHHPLFQVMLALQNTPKSDLELPGVVVSPVATPSTAAKFDLTFILHERRGPGGEPRGLEGYVEYAAELFDPATVERIVTRWARLLDAVAAAPDQLVNRVDVLDRDERDRLVATQSRETDPTPVTELFEARVRAHPDAAAVVQDDVVVTYAELNARANQLARVLARHGAGPGALVALALPRTPDLLVAILAVLKSGAAYVPLDPSYPEARVRATVEDSRPLLVLTTSDHSTPGGAPSLALDSPATQARLARAEDSDLGLTLPPGQPAYVIHTSGSTGRPKGVVISGGALSSFVCSMREHVPLGPGDRLPWITTVAFDMAVPEIYLPVLSGATTILVTREVVTDPPALADLLVSTGATHFQATPSLWQALVTTRPESLRGLRMLVGGEALPAELAATMRSLGCGVTNFYGPTETTVWSTAEVLDGSRPVPPIGRPIANARAHVLDTGLQPVPAEVAGELYLGGDGLALGYLGRAAHTAERFVADPFGPPGGRLYRTGDLVRWLPDGRLEFLGRADNQVKVRGFRIELGEIEAVLAAHRDVTQAVAVVREDRPGDSRLVAYVVPVPGAAVGAEVLLAHVRAALPEYMVPATAVVLSELPLTPNGKVDRAALPAPEYRAGTGRAPETPAEKALCELFAEVLGLESVSADDNFFELGGHSLLATRLVSRVRAVLGQELSVRALFECPTAGRAARRLGAPRRQRPQLVGRKGSEEIS